MRITYLLLTIVFLVGCTTQKVSYTKLANRQMNQFAQEMEREKKFILSGSGGAMMDCISDFDLVFKSPYPLRLTVPQARELMIQFVERLKNEVNHNESIRPYLCKYPIDDTNIRMSLTFWDAPCKRVPKEFVAMVWLRNGCIYYSFFDTELGQYTEADIKEPYAEALKLVHKD